MPYQAPVSPNLACTSLNPHHVRSTKYWESVSCGCNTDNSCKRKHASVRVGYLQESIVKVSVGCKRPLQELVETEYGGKAMIMGGKEHHKRVVSAALPKRVEGKHPTSSSHREPQRPEKAAKQSCCCCCCCCCTMHARLCNKVHKRYPNCGCTLS